MTRVWKCSLPFLKDEKTEETKGSDFPWTQRIEVSEQIKMLKSGEMEEYKETQYKCLEQKSLSQKLVKTLKWSFGKLLEAEFRPVWE